MTGEEKSPLEGYVLDVEDKPEGDIIYHVTFYLPERFKGIIMIPELPVQHRYLSENKKNNLLCAFSNIPDDHNSLKWLKVQIIRPLSLKF